MKTQKEIRAKLRELKKDVRHNYKPALVEVNAPLALIQVQIQAEIDTLDWVLRGK